MDEFEQEFAQLYEEVKASEYPKRANQESEPFYTVSIEAERQALLDAFYDEYAKLVYSSSNDDFSENDDSFIAMSLSVSLLDHVERSEVLREGEVCVRGEGLFEYLSNADSAVEGEEEEEFCIEPGDMVVGTIQQFSASSMVPYDVFMQFQRDLEPQYDDKDIETIGPWLVLSEVVIMKADGARETYDGILVPFNYPSLTFEKVVRQSEAARDFNREKAAILVDITDKFTDYKAFDVLNKVDNDFKYSGYEGESLDDARRVHQEDLQRADLERVDLDAKIVVSATRAQFLGKGEGSLTAQNAHYNGATVMPVDGEWRTVYTFELMTSEGLAIACVLPEDITGVYLQEDE